YSSINFYEFQRAFFTSEDAEYAYLFCVDEESTDEEYGWICLTRTPFDLRGLQRGFGFLPRMGYK
nr:hypothetical protein [Candidatus Sigynarchaeota archaeon]